MELSHGSRILKDKWEKAWKSLCSRHTQVSAKRRTQNSLESGFKIPVIRVNYWSFQVKFTGQLIAKQFSEPLCTLKSQTKVKLGKVWKTRNHSSWPNWPNKSERQQRTWPDWNSSPWLQSKFMPEISPISCQKPASHWTHSSGKNNSDLELHSKENPCNVQSNRRTPLSPTVTSIKETTVDWSLQRWLTDATWLWPQPWTWKRVVLHKGLQVLARLKQSRILVKVWPSLFWYSTVQKDLIIRVWVECSRGLCKLVDGDASISSTESSLKCWVLLPNKCCRFWTPWKLFKTTKVDHRTRSVSYSKAPKFLQTTNVLSSSQWTPVTQVVHNFLTT